jgi:hypothetical protein
MVVGVAASLGRYRVLRYSYLGKLECRAKERKEIRALCESWRSAALQ